MTLITYATQNCDDCKRLCDVDILTTYDLDDRGNILRSFCDKCLSKYPKHDPRDWRAEDHPDAFGIVTWYDGTKSFKDENGELHDVLDANALDVYDDDEEFVPSLEGFLNTAGREVLAFCGVIIIMLCVGVILNALMGFVEEVAR